MKEKYVFFRKSFKIHLIHKIVFWFSKEGISSFHRIFQELQIQNKNIFQYYCFIMLDINYIFHNYKLLSYTTLSLGPCHPMSQYGQFQLMVAL